MFKGRGFTQMQAYVRARMRASRDNGRDTHRAGRGSWERCGQAKAGSVLRVNDMKEGRNAGCGVNIGVLSGKEDKKILSEFNYFLFL